MAAGRVASRAEENPDLPIRYKALLDYLAKFQGGRKPGKAMAQAGDGAEEAEA